MRNEGESKLVTSAELWKSIGSPFKPRHFVSEPEPCGNRRLFLPVPTIPTHMMSGEEAEQTKAALDACTRIVGLWGDSISKKDSPEFLQVAEAFKKLTGVDAWEVIELARSRLLQQNG